MNTKINDAIELMRKTTEPLTYGQILGPAMSVKTEDEANRYLEAMIQHNMRLFSQSRGEAQRIALANVGYWTGYSDHQTAKRVMALFKTAHPIFGTSQPTSKEAFAAGEAEGKKMHLKKAQA
jgi:hypothetical protein